MAPFQWLKEAITPLLQTNLPSSFLAIVFLILLLVLNYLLKQKNPKKQSYNLPPSPPKLPIIGNLHQLGNLPHLSLRRLSDKFGPIIHLQLGEIPTVVVSSARLAKEVLKTHDLAISSRPRIYGAKYLFYNCTDIAFSPYGAYWRHIRKICILELLSAKRVQSYSYVREEEVERLIRRIADQSYKKNNVDLSKMLGLYANDVVCRSSFGRDFSEGGEYDKHGFQKMLEEYQALLGGFSLGDYFPSMEWIHSITGIKSRLVNTTGRFDRFFDEIIEEHRNSKKAGKGDHKDIVDVLLNIKKDDENLTMDNIKAVILDMFAGGTDTTFATLDWGMTELVTNPRVMEKAQNEIRTIVGDRKTVLESDLPQMHYLKAVIKETFRMHPPATVLMPRESMEDITIDGYNIPAKTRFTVNAWAIGRDPECWENPNVFEPERFMSSTLDYKGLDFEFIPFGSGRRMCPALTFGVAGIELSIAQLLHSFDWELPHSIRAEDLDMTEVFGITMHRISHLILIAKPRFH
ncbi:Cytochrome P450 [Macleaya cordata]|uniref:Cytochrome P450 n=1 Tax=Macleaya cordata TaxID=56857 RepID=A0A200R4H7_MACCD|nr:Cytochrome P450 [Macleaya cordata]